MIQESLEMSLMDATMEEILEAQAFFLAHTGSMMPFEPVVPNLNAPIQTPNHERALITWQKDDLSPFVELKLGGNSPQKRAFTRRLARLQHNSQIAAQLKGKKPIFFIFPHKSGKNRQPQLYFFVFCSSF